MKHNNIHIMVIPEREEKEQGIKNLFEDIMTKIFQNLVKENDRQVQELKGVTKKMTPKRPTPRHIIITMTKLKDKERILKVAREKWLVTYQGPLIRLSFDFSTKHFRPEGNGMNYSR